MTRAGISGTVLAVVLLAAGPALAAEPPAKKEGAPVGAGEQVFVFSGRVTRVVMLMEFTGEARFTHFDPRYVFGIRLEKAAPEDPAFPVGKEIHWAIHSPALLFGRVGLTEAKEIEGQRFELRVTRETEQGRVRWTGLRVERRLPAE